MFIESRLSCLVKTACSMLPKKMFKLIHCPIRGVLIYDDNNFQINSPTCYVFKFQIFNQKLFLFWLKIFNASICYETSVNTINNTGVGLNTVFSFVYNCTPNPVVYKVLLGTFCCVKVVKNTILLYRIFWFNKWFYNDHYRVYVLISLLNVFVDRKRNYKFIVDWNLWFLLWIFIHLFRNFIFFC